MRLFVWEQIEKATDAYHSEGGVLVVAENLTRAQEICPCIKDIAPDHVYTVDDSNKELTLIFPNSGCC